MTQILPLSGFSIQAGPNLLRTPTAIQVYHPLKSDDYEWKASIIEVVANVTPEPIVSRLSAPVAAALASVVDEGEIARDEDAITLVTPKVTA
jgi:hypothetical protein